MNEETRLQSLNASFFIMMYRLCAEKPFPLQPPSGGKSPAASRQLLTSRPLSQLATSENKTLFTYTRKTAMVTGHDILVPAYLV